MTKGGYHEPLFRADGKRHRVTRMQQHGQAVLEAHHHAPDAVSKHACRSLCEGFGLITAVIGNCDTRFRKGFLHVICKTLRCTAHGIDIHSAGSGAEDAAKTARTESEVLIEALTDCFRVAADLFQLLDEVRILCCILTPEAVQCILFCHIGLHGTSFLSSVRRIQNAACAVNHTHTVIIAYFICFAKGQNTEF